LRPIETNFCTQISKKQLVIEFIKLIDSNYRFYLNLNYSILQKMSINTRNYKSIVVSYVITNEPIHFVLEYLILKGRI